MIDPTRPVAVIGAGVVGMACARALQRARVPVLVLDPNEPGSGCSAGNAGRIATELVRPLAQPGVLYRLPRLLLDSTGPLALRAGGMPALLPWMARFLRSCLPSCVAAGTQALATLLSLTLPAWRDEIEASGLGDLFIEGGTYVVYESRGSLARAKAEAEDLRRYGIPYEDLDPPTARGYLPMLRVRLRGARYFPGTWHVTDPRAVVERMAVRFADEGGHIEKAAVVGFNIERGRVTHVRIDNDTITVGGIVVAAGAGASIVTGMLGSPVPLARERGYHVMVPGEDLPLGAPVTFEDRGFVCTPMAAGTRLAGTVELGVGDEPDWRRADILAAHARTLFGLPKLAVASRWFGNRPTLPDYLPMIGFVPRVANAIVAVGHQHLGLTLAAATGQLVKELAMGGRPSIDLAPFRVDRFGSMRMSGA
jgi:D-amino-acid dehydrogenase